MKKTVFTGSGVALVTPFNEDLSVNFDMLSQLIDWHLENKTDALVMCGTTGESATLTTKEKEDIFKFTVKKVGRKIPVIAGCGTNCTESTVALSKAALDCGADAALIVTPYYNKTTQDGILRHYEIISNSAHIPVIIYNVPSRTGFGIKPDTYRRLAEIENVVAVKEASGDISALAESISLCNGLIDFYSGNDDQIVPFYSLGGKGVISVVANICPLQIHNLCMLCENGDFANAASAQLDLISLCKAMFCEVNPLPVKFAVNELGFDVGKTRPPLFELSGSSKQYIKSVLVK